MSSWRTFELGGLVSLASGGSFPTKYQGEKDGDYDFYKVSDMNNFLNKKYMSKSKNKVSEKIKEKMKSKIHPPETIIFPKVGAALLTNKRRILTKPSAFDNNIMGVIAKDKIDYNFLYYYLSTIDFVKYSQTGAIPSINNKIVSSLIIDLPENIYEQQKIAAILSSVDEVIEKTEQIIEQTNTMKKGLMQQLFTKGIGHTEFRDSEFGKIPSDWEIVPLTEKAEIIMGQSPNSVDCNENGEGLPFYQGVSDFGSIYPNPTRFCTKPKKIAQKNDVLLSVRAPVGEVNIVNQKVVIGRGVSAIKPKNINHIFLFYYLKYHKNKWDRLQQGSTFTAINKNDLMNIRIFNTLDNEQQEIVSMLTNQDEKIEIEKNNLEYLIKLKQGLMQQLLTGKVRVPIDESEEVSL